MLKNFPNYQYEGAYYFAFFNQFIMKGEYTQLGDLPEMLVTGFEFHARAYRSELAHLSKTNTNEKNITYKRRLCLASFLLLLHHFYKRFGWKNPCPALINRVLQACYSFIPPI